MASDSRLLGYAAQGVWPKTLQSQEHRVKIDAAFFWLVLASDIEDELHTGRQREQKMALVL